MKSLFIIVFSAILIWISGQEKLLDEKAIHAFNKELDKLNSNFHPVDSLELYALTQTTGDYFRVYVDDEAKFLEELNNSRDINVLRNKYPEMFVDRNLLIVRYIREAYSKKDGIKVIFNSYEIGKNDKYYIKKENSDENLRNELKNIIISKKDTLSNEVLIYGFVFHHDFKRDEISKPYKEWVQYADYIINPSTSIFRIRESKRYFSNNSKNEFRNYINVKNPKPKFVPIMSPEEFMNQFSENDSIANLYFEKKQKQLDYHEKLKYWNENRLSVADSLNRNDPNFKIILNKAVSEAIDSCSYIDNELVYYASNFIDKKVALELVRAYPIQGTCSWDESPRDQQRQIANLAAQTGNWPIFIKTSMNLLNDYASRIANNNISHNARSTYANELSQLNLDLVKILLGSNIRFTDSNKNNSHYYSDNGKVGVAIASSDSANRRDFENKAFYMLADSTFDSFNKLNLYNTLTFYQKSLERIDSLESISFNKKFKNAINDMPEELKARIQNPNLQLYEGLFNSEEFLNKLQIHDYRVGFSNNFKKHRIVYYIECSLKNGDSSIIYNLKFSNEDKNRKLSEFLKFASKIESQVNRNPFIKELIESSSDQKLYVQYIHGQSYNSYNEFNSMQLVSEELNSMVDFKNSIVLMIITKRGKENFYFYLTEKDEVVFIDIPYEFATEKYNFEKLLREKRKVGKWDNCNISNHIFDKNGNIIY